MIQPIVEGEGEVQAIRILLVRLFTELGVYLPIHRPIRRHRRELVREADFKRALQLAVIASNTQMILVLFDLDDDCARQLLPDMKRWVGQTCGLPCALVFARREYEGWFLGAIESLRGQCRIKMAAVYPADPEVRRGAKEALSRWMPRNQPYDETADQPTLTKVFELKAAYRRCSSFRKLVSELCRILSESGYAPVIPADWTDS